MRPVFGVCVLVIVCGLPATARAKDPVVIKPEDARNHVGEKCVTTFKVQHTKHGVNRKTYFLDSQVDFKAPENLGVQISEKLAERLKETKAIAEPHVYFANKTIRVAGPIFLEENRPYLRLEDPADITVEDSK